jgi:N-methylhydantoinase B/oxoprolinase/acetone carboxylase alpha subunit
MSVGVWGVGGGEPGADGDHTWAQQDQEAGQAQQETPSWGTLNQSPKPTHSQAWRIRNLPQSAWPGLCTNLTSA